MCCLVLQSNFALLLTIQFALLISSLINIISLLLTTLEFFIFGGSLLGRIQGDREPVSFFHCFVSCLSFILPGLSSHFVLHDLLRSFRLEHPLSSSCVPPWDLLLVLWFLHGPPLEPLSSCSLRDLTQKVLFLVSLATARCVGELQAVSRYVSFSGSDIYLSYLPEFRTETESSANPLPRSFCVRALGFRW